MKLNYLELLSPEPIRIPQVGSVISPTLRDIAVLGYETYQHYLSILLLDPGSYLALLGQEEAFQGLSEEEKARLTIFDLLLGDHKTALLLQDILNFFFQEPVSYSARDHGFLVGEEASGIITKELYPGVCDLICQRNRIRTSHEDLSKVTSKKARKILEKLQKGRAQKAAHSSVGKELELGNIISAVANKSSSLNIINIWDLTIYQLWDCFFRLSNNHIYEIQAMSVAAWGNKNHSFDAALWYQPVEKL